MLVALSRLAFLYGRTSIRHSCRGCMARSFDDGGGLPFSQRNIVVGCWHGRVQHGMFSRGLDRAARCAPIIWFKPLSKIARRAAKSNVVGSSFSRNAVREEGGAASSHISDLSIPYLLAHVIRSIEILCWHYCILLLVGLALSFSNLRMRKSTSGTAHALSLSLIIRDRTDYNACHA